MHESSSFDLASHFYQGHAGSNGGAAASMLSHFLRLWQSADWQPDDSRIEFDRGKIKFDGGGLEDAEIVRSAGMIFADGLGKLALTPAAATTGVRLTYIPYSSERIGGSLEAWSSHEVSVRLRWQLDAPVNLGADGGFWWRDGSQFWSRGDAFAASLALKLGWPLEAGYVGGLNVGPYPS